MATLLDGKQLATTMQAEIAAEVARLGIHPGLAAVLVGENPASQVYVRNKRKACDQAGMRSWLHQLPAELYKRVLLIAKKSRRLPATPLSHLLGAAKTPSSVPPEGIP